MLLYPLEAVLSARSATAGAAPALFTRAERPRVRAEVKKESFILIENVNANECIDVYQQERIEVPSVCKP